MFKDVGGGGRGLAGIGRGRGRVKKGLVEDITSDIDIDLKRPVHRKQLPDIPIDVISDIGVDPPKKPPFIIRPPFINGTFGWKKPPEHVFKPHVFIAKKEDVERAELEDVSGMKISPTIAGGFKQVLTTPGVTPGVAVTPADKQKKTLLYIIIGAVVVVGFIAMRR